MSEWWEAKGYYSFERGKDGFPRPGQVVKYYRKAKRKDNGKSWTQKDLAIALGISEQAVRDLENRDVGMDSYDRRRFLADLFAIPPMLLGIVSLEELLKSKENKKLVMSQTNNAANKPVVDTAEYQQALLQFWGQNHSYMVQGALTDVLGRLDTLYRALPYVRSQKSRIMELLCEYHQFVANILRDQQHFSESVDHLNKALALAKATDNKELQALVYHRRGITLQEQGNVPAALRDYMEACKLELFLSPQLQGAILLEMGHVQAKLAQNETDKTIALKTIDRGGKIVRNSASDDDPYFLRLNEDRYHLTRGSALIAVQWNKEAVVELTQVKSNQKRRQAYNDILQAQAYTNRGMYPLATSMVREALVTVKEINSVVNIARIAAIYTQLKQSSYGSNPEVARLGFMLQSR